MAKSVCICLYNIQMDWIGLDKYTILTVFVLTRFELLITAPAAFMFSVLQSLRKKIDPKYVQIHPAN